MNQTTATLKVALFDRVVCIRIAGKANFNCSLDLKRLVHELADRGYDRFVLDLTECALMDSTFLGVIAGIGLKFASQNGEATGAVELLNPNARINDLLENLGVAHLFKICAEMPPPEETFQPIVTQPGEANRAEVTRTCLEAHKTLMNINPENARKFKDVTQFLAEDLRRMEGAGAAGGESQ